MWIRHRKELKKLTFWGLGLYQSETYLYPSDLISGKILNDIVQQEKAPGICDWSDRINILTEFTSVTALFNCRRVLVLRAVFV